MRSYLITGASSGIGLSITKFLLARGDFVWGVGLRSSPPDVLVASSVAARSRYLQCDVSDWEQVAATVAEIEQDGAVPDTVVLCAGIQPEQPSDPLRTEVIENVIDVNYLGALRWVERLLPMFVQRGAGEFVAISSLAAFRGDRRWFGYSASKAALDRSFESLRGRYGQTGIRFLTIHLGATRAGTGLHHRAPWMLSDEAAISKIVAAIDGRSDQITIPRSARFLLELSRFLSDRRFSKLVSRVSD